MRTRTVGGLRPPVRLASALGALALGVFLPRRAWADGIWLPENISTLGEKIDHLWGVIFWIVIVAFVLSEGALVYCLIRFRNRPGRKARYIHDDKRLETLWWVVPGAVLLFIALYQYGTWAEAKIRPPDEASSLRVQIWAKQFEWHIRYPGPDDRFATSDDVTLTNQLYIPENKNILIQLRAADVIHSFFLPNLRVKQDIVPGITTLVWFDARKTGDYEIACSELCGLGHYRMRGQLYIRSAAEFDGWLAGKVTAGAVPEKGGWDWQEGL